MHTREHIHMSINVYYINVIYVKYYVCKKYIYSKKRNAQFCVFIVHTYSIMLHSTGYYCHTIIKNVKYIVKALKHLAYSDPINL